MAAETTKIPNQGKVANLLSSNTYNIFILVLTIYSLVLMVIQMLEKPGTDIWILTNRYDNLICLFFLADFAMRMYAEPVKSKYFIKERGFLDLLGSLPNLGAFQFAALFRLFRLSRLFRLRRLMNPENRKLLGDEVVHNRGQYALLITALLAAIVLTMASIFVLYFESKSPDANITTGQDALWWAIVTITTVGYGDRYPVTIGGRVVAVFVMFAGVGIIGALASILASILVPQPQAQDAQPESPKSPELEQKLDAVTQELSAMRELLEKMQRDANQNT